MAEIKFFDNFSENIPVVFYFDHCYLTAGRQLAAVSSLCELCCHCNSFFDSHIFVIAFLIAFFKVFQAVAVKLFFTAELIRKLRFFLAPCEKRFRKGFVIALYSASASGVKQERYDCVSLYCAAVISVATGCSYPRTALSSSPQEQKSIATHKSIHSTDNFFIVQTPHFQKRAEISPPVTDRLYILETCAYWKVALVQKHPCTVHLANNNSCLVGLISVFTFDSVLDLYLVSLCKLILLSLFAAEY